MIEVKNIYKSFSGVSVLKDINTVFEQGKTNLIIGQSGSGKTVLLKSIVGLHEVDRGKICFGDTIFNELNFKDKKQMRTQMGMLFQGGALFDSATVEENVMFPLDMFTEMSQDEKRDRANECLKRVNIINANNLYPAEISGGMQKRVAIARAIALNPKYLFCDEPNSGLDPKTAILIDNLIQEITQEFNMTTIVNTHDMNSVMEIGDKVMFIYKGEKWWEGTNNDIFDSTNKELNDFIFASKLSQKIRDLKNSNQPSS
ncbi:MAG: ATP-binding cassette domain-containing protein [Bacteroidetes bacterium]|nr:ATP-binding cassette domain-containing protein [Bacteroidota bacterium]